MSDNIKPILDYLEIEISEFCNLNCRGCCDFSNLATEKRIYPFNEYEKDMHRLHELFGGIEKFGKYDGKRQAR